MKNLAALRQMPTHVDVGTPRPRIHESCFRAYGCLQMVIEILHGDPCPPSILLAVIRDVMDAPFRIAWCDGEGRLHTEGDGPCV